MMKREDNADDDFVTKTNKSRKKSTKSGSEEAKEGVAPGSTATTAGNGAGTVPAEGISLRPRTMFTVKGRGRTESEGSPAYRPQWSKDGDGFVSNTAPSTGAGKESDDRDSRRKGKVLRYSKEELLALHTITTTPPKFPDDAAVASEHPLPPVSTLPFDYEEIYKQWSLNRNRGRGRGRTTGSGSGQNAEGGGASERSRSNGKWDEDKWDKPKRGDGRQRGDGDDKWKRGAQAEGGQQDGIWDDVGLAGGDSIDFDLSTMAAAAEQFRREMDAMRDQERQKLEGPADGVDMDVFDQKLEEAAATGQFEDSDDEVHWEMPNEPAKGGLGVESPILFDSAFSQKLPSPNALALEEPSFSLSALADSSFSLGPLVVEARDEWFYLDPQGLQQGPFTTAEMREWFEAGYFKPNLPIRFGHDGAFTPLANHFLQGQLPFASPPRPSPKVALDNEARLNEQQRLMEMHRQQQQQMMQLQQQQEQQRMLQFNQEEKIRLEMQRLELARQQQNHLFQQQQQIIHQQQQQQQQQMMLQQQSSWQRSQREGIMSALGIFGGSDGGLGGVKEAFPSEAPHQFQPDFRGQHQPAFEAQNAVRIQNAELVPNTNDDPWGANSGQQPRNELSHQSEFFGVGPQQVAQESAPLPHRSEKPSDPWGTSSQTAQGSVSKDSHSPAKQHNTVDQNAQGERDGSTTTADASEKGPKANKVSSSVKEKAKVSPTKLQQRGHESAKRDSAWASAPSSTSGNKKSLKDIQDEEQRELRKNVEEQEESADLAHMGAQLKMMLGVSAGSARPTHASGSQQNQATRESTPPPAPAAPSASPWGRAAAVVQQPQSGKSMREILAEEERLAAERAKKSEGAPTSSHWMNVVAGNTAPVAAVPKPSRLGPVPASVLKSTTRQSRTSVSGDALAAIPKKPLTTASKAESDASFWNFGAAQTVKGDSGAPTSSANFGSGKFGSDFTSWCHKQLKAINGSEDLTLVEYCATLEDPGEIREYLAAYLGSTPRVSAFATEFIQRKKSLPTSLRKVTEATSDEAVDSNGSKKAAKRRTKGQKIDPSLLNYSVGN